MKKVSKINNDEQSFSSVSEDATQERLSQVLKKDNSLDDMSVEQRRKEASKPLYLVRYE
jgi:hypothetical protein